MGHNDKYYAYLKSKAWADLKLDIIHLRGQKCERCGSKRSLRFLHLHHLTYDRLYDELPEDLELICAGCHSVEHGIIPPKPKPFRFKKRRKNIKPKIDQALKMKIKEAEQHVKSGRIGIQAYVDKVKALRRGEGV